MYERIRALREDRDLSQKQLSQALHCSQQVYSNYELGQRDIPTAILIALADFYGTSTDYILGRTDEKERPHNEKSRARRSSLRRARLFSVKAVWENQTISLQTLLA